MSAAEPQPEGSEAAGGLLRAGGLRTPAAWTARELALGAALLALALAVRLTRLGAGSLSAIDPLRGEPAATAWDVQLLYPLLARISAALLGAEAWALRLPAALLGAAGVLAFWRLGLRFTERREALFAAALVAVSYDHVSASQTASGETALFLFGVLATWALAGMLAAPGVASGRAVAAYGVCAALAVLAHPLGLLALAVHALVWLTLAARAAPGAQRWRPGLGLLLAVGLAALGWWLLLQRVAPSRAVVDLALPVAQRDLLASLRAGLSGASPWLPEGELGVTLVLAAAVAAGLGLWGYAQQGPEVLALLVLPALLGLPLAASHPQLLGVLWTAHLGAIVLVVLRGITLWVRLFARAPPLSTIRVGLERLALGLLVLANAAMLPLAYEHEDPLQPALRFVEARRRPGDVAVLLAEADAGAERPLPADWTRIAAPEELEGVESARGRTWLVLESPAGEGAELLPPGYTSARSFPARAAGRRLVVAIASE